MLNKDQLVLLDSKALLDLLDLLPLLEHKELLDLLDLSVL
jgi:hypothetical protein